MTFDDDYSAYWVYFVNFLGTLAVLPGNIVSALLMDKIGRLSMLGGARRDLSGRGSAPVKRVKAGEVRGASVSCRGLHGAVRHQLLLPLVRHQRVHDDLHALPLQRPQHLRLELPGRRHH